MVILTNRDTHNLQSLHSEKLLEVFSWADTYLQQVCQMSLWFPHIYRRSLTNINILFLY